MQWSKEFLAVCEELDMEPVETNGSLILLCSERPELDMMHKFDGIIPEDVKVTVRESLRTITVAAIQKYLQDLGVKEGMFMMSADHYVHLEVLGDHEAKFEKGSPVWTDVRAALLMDKFTKGIMIKYNGKVVLYNTTEDLGVAELMDKPAPQAETLMVAVNDSRFDDGRAYLPKDVATDVRILLESTNSIDEFLQRI
jgi:hypothetical protein